MTRGSLMALSDGLQMFFLGLISFMAGLFFFVVALLINPWAWAALIAYIIFRFWGGA